MDAGRHRDFLRELAALDEFLGSQRPGVLQREDPDVRRLMESIALFSVRTRERATDELRGAVQRIVHGHLDDFLVPQPSRGLVRAVPDPRLVDPVTLPRGTQVRLRSQEGDVGLFTTTRNLTIRPLQLDWAERRLRGRDGYRILLRLRSRGAVRDMPEPLALHLDHQNDYAASLRLFTRLRRCLRDVSVIYDDPPADDRHGSPCAFSFGGAGEADALPTTPGHRGEGTAASIREFFHHPRGELFLTLGLPPSARTWRQAWLCLDVDAEWPDDQAIGTSMFRLFVVPIENLFVDATEPIKADGTRTSHPLRPSQTGDRVSFHSIVEVSQPGVGGQEPILPAHVASGRENYELDLADDGGPQLLLRLPDAFARPRVVSVQARWYQPWFDDVAVGKLEAALQTRRVDGVELHLHGSLQPHEPCSLWRDADTMLHVMSRRSKRILSRHDIVDLMTILGAHEHSHHGDVAADVLHVETGEEPADLRRGGGVAYVYRVILADGDEDRRGLQDGYLRRVGELLNAWSSNPVRLEVERRADATPARRGGGR